MPLGRFMNQNPMGGNPMGNNPMAGNPMGNGMGFPRQNLFRQILASPGVQNQMPNFMKGLQKFLGPSQPFGQGGNSQYFGQGGPGPSQPLGQGQSQLFGSQNFGQGGGLSPFGGGFLHNQGMNVPGMGQQNNPMMQYGNIPPGASGTFDNTLSVQAPQPQQQPQPQQTQAQAGGGLIQNILSRLGIGK